MRIAFLFAAVVAIGAVIGVGLKQASDKQPAGGVPGGIHPSAAKVRDALAGSPPALASLHARADQLLPGAKAALQRELKALKGHPVVVNSWAGWCGPCNVEAPIFQRTALKLGRSVAFLGVNGDDDHGSSMRFRHRYPMSFPSIDDPDKAAMASLKMTSLPTTAFISAAGKLTITHAGAYISQAQLEADIRRYAINPPS